MRYLLCVGLWVLSLSPPCLARMFDTDGDGRTDFEAACLADEDNDGCYDQPTTPPGKDACSDSVTFTQVWTSGTVLNNQWDACCGHFDEDSLLDILGHHWNPNVLHVFESDGAGSYVHKWEQPESLPPGSYCTVTAGDPDDDGKLELLGGEVSTLGKVVILENLANDSWGSPVVPVRLRNERIRTVRVADTDGDDTNEIIVVTGDATEGGKVVIMEHAGAPGEHSYVQRYEYTTVSYLFQAEVCDADNDDFPEVLLGVGGWHGFPMNIRRIVYDPGTQAYSHKMFTSIVIGLPIAPVACRLDSSGENLLLVGSSGDPNGNVHIFKYTGNDTFAPVWSVPTGTSGNVISVTAARFEGIPNPVFFAAPFGGAVYGYSHNGSGYVQLSYFSPGTGSAIRSIDAARDIRDELILAESAPADYISVYRRDVTGAVADLTFQSRPALAVSPSTGKPPFRITSSFVPRTTRVHDVQGRTVALLEPRQTALWDARGVAPGVFFVSVTAEARASSAKLVLCR